MPREILGIVPARGGSKSIKKKNIAPLGGKPLVYYILNSMNTSRYITRTVVSTEDSEIAEVCRECGADVPFERPIELAQDDTPTTPVLEHAIQWLAENEDYHPDIVAQLRPTSPVRPPNCVDRAVQLLLDNPDADSVRGVVTSGQNPFKMWRIQPDGFMQPLGTELGIPNEPYNQPRQALPDVYWQTGYVDAAWADTLLVKNSMTGDTILPLVIEASEWVDIDSQDDWHRAERMLESGEIQWDDLGFNID